MQAALDQGVAAVDAKIAARQQMEALAPPAAPEPEKDDGHVETVEEVRAKMAAAQAAMNEGLANVNRQADQRAQETEMMPDMGALTTITGTIHKMGLSQKQRQVNLLAAKLGVIALPGDD